MRTFIITGASKGIGKAIAEKLLREGHRIVGISRSPTISHERFVPYPLDMEKDISKSLKSLKDSHPDVDGIICSAGRGLFGHLEQLSFEDMSSLMNLNFLSQVFLIKTYLPLMKKRQSGEIVMIGSEAALNGKRKGSLYCASKFALRGFAQALREECAASRIRVSLINPGMTATSFFDKLDFRHGEDSSEHIEPEDIAALVSAVLSMRQGTVCDEINLSPQKKVVKFGTIEN